MTGEELIEKLQALTPEQRKLQVWVRSDYYAEPAEDTGPYIDDRLVNEQMAKVIQIDGAYFS